MGDGRNDPDLQTHLPYLRMAMDLAVGGRGRTSPNPMVGAVLVKNGIIVGTGFHSHAGAPHAEAVALAEAGHEARGAILYVNLEPCCHFGRTPPCVERIIDNGVRAVYACLRDPDPRVDGRGFEALRNGGVPVEEGFLREEALHLNEAFAKFVQTRRPFLVVKGAMSLDGKLATQKGDSFWISGEESRQFGHRLRFESDAIMVGCGTVLQDDPRLTIRAPGLQEKQLTRVIMDSQLHCPVSAAVLRTQAQGPVLIYAAPDASTAARRELEKAGALVITIPAPGGRVSLREALLDMGRRNLTSVLLEGGGTLIGTAFRHGMVDKCFLFLAPLFIGGDRSPGLIRDAGWDHLADCPRLDSLRLSQRGRDILLEGYPVFTDVIEESMMEEERLSADSAAGGV